MTPSRFELPADAYWAILGRFIATIAVGVVLLGLMAFARPDATEGNLVVRDAVDVTTGQAVSRDEWMSRALAQ